MILSFTDSFGDNFAFEKENKKRERLYVRDSDQGIIRIPSKMSDQQFSKLYRMTNITYK